MKRTLSLLLCCLILLACVFGMLGCYINPTYRGQYKELYTVAVYSIPDVVGYMYHGEGSYSSDIYIWEHDDYGRTLFSYCEDYGNRIFGLVVSQGYDDTNVYFYPDANYMLTVIDSEYMYEGVGEDHLKNRTESFYLEHREKLKEANDWNKPLDKTKCVSYQIVNEKVLGKNIYKLSHNQCNEILQDYTQTLNIPNPEPAPHRVNSILQVDAQGNILHQIKGVHRNYDKIEGAHYTPEDYTCYDMILWVITDKDGNYDKENGVMVMYSEANGDCCFVYNAADVLEFKNKNGWVSLYCD